MSEAFLLEVEQSALSQKYLRFPGLCAWEAQRKLLNHASSAHSTDNWATKYWVTGESEQFHMQAGRTRNVTIFWYYCALLLLYPIFKCMETFEEDIGDAYSAVLKKAC